MNDLIDNTVLDTLKKEFSKDTYEQLVNIYITDIKNNLDQLEKYIKDNNSSAAHMTAHSIKGSSSSMGVIKLTTLSAEIETFCKDGNIAKASEHLIKLKETAMETLQLLS